MLEQYSPKSSPRGSRSPVVPRQDSTGTLKTTISLGKTPAIVHSGPFYLMKEPACESEMTGATNLMTHYSLEHSYNKFCCGRKMKDQLSAFLPNLPGNIDAPGSVDNSSLRSLIDKPPIGGREIISLTQDQLAGFRLHPGPLPEQYRLMNQPVVKKKHKQKKNKHTKPGDTPSQELVPDTLVDSAVSGSHEKKHKRQRKHDDEKERKKKKKEKKKKKQKHSPEPCPLPATGTLPSNSNANVI